MRLFKILMISFLTIASSCAPAQTIQQSALVCYGDFYPAAVTGLDYVIVEPQLFSPEDVAVLKKQNKKVLAYISLGEVNAAAVHYDQIKEETLKHNPLWNSYVIDIAAPKTREALLAIIERHLAVQQFDGLFLDNIDNYTIYGPTPEKKEALVSFLSELKSRFRESVLLQNAGLQIVDATSPYIDAIAVESVATDYDFENKKYCMRSAEGFKKRMGNIQEMQKDHNIPVLLIEYAKTLKMRNEVLKKMKPYDLPIFVGQIELQKIPEFN